MVAVRRDALAWAPDATLGAQRAQVSAAVFVHDVATDGDQARASALAARERLSEELEDRDLRYFHHAAAPMLRRPSCSFARRVSSAGGSFLARIARTAVRS